jgi:hypothetical protein
MVQLNRVNLPEFIQFPATDSIKWLLEAGNDGDEINNQGWRRY